MAIWNDEWYDAVAVFSGSTTVVDGKPVIIYPGLCTKKHCPHGGHCPCSGFAGTNPTSTYGSTYNAAVPANLADPFLTNWTKPSYNPLVNGTGDDPSTAWKTASGEWRLIGNQQGGGSGAPIYGSKDFKTWYKIGFTTLKLGDCPTPGAPIRLHDAHAHPWCAGMGSAHVHTWLDPKESEFPKPESSVFAFRTGEAHTLCSTFVVVVAIQTWNSASCEFFCELVFVLRAKP